MLGLPYIHHKKRKHFPPIDHKKDDISTSCFNFFFLPGMGRIICVRELDIYVIIQWFVLWNPDLRFLKENQKERKEKMAEDKKQK